MSLKNSKLKFGYGFHHSLEYRGLCKEGIIHEELQLQLRFNTIDPLRPLFNTVYRQIDFISYESYKKKI